MRDTHGLKDCHTSFQKGSFRDCCMVWGFGVLDFWQSGFAFRDAELAYLLESFFF